MYYFALKWWAYSFVQIDWKEISNDENIGDERLVGDSGRLEIKSNVPFDNNNTLTA